jgi:uncharacterized repeat protein (TIGR03803 family)
VAKSFFSGWIALAAMGCLAAMPSLAGTYQTLYAFTGGADGAYPSTPVVVDAAGNVYGETYYGGIDPLAQCFECGTIYKISPMGQITVLVTFQGTNGANGLGPLTLQGSTLYGSTYDGFRAQDRRPTSRGGLLFSVRTDGSRFRVLYRFIDDRGPRPAGPLIPAANGVLYGYTHGYRYGRNGGDDLFRLTTDGTFTTLYDFRDSPYTGQPNALLMDATGTLFGSTVNSSYGGTVFSLVPSTGVYTTLYHFNSQTGPILGSIGPDGTLYGATAKSGQFNAGELFSLTPAGGTYTLKRLVSLPAVVGTSGAESGPTYGAGGVLFEAASNLYKYENGRLVTLYASTLLQETQPAIAGQTVYGTTFNGGVTPCPGLYYPGSCGTVYSYTEGSH